MEESKAERPVLITTAHRGVFFGYLDNGQAVGETTTIKRARNCIYWDASVKGFLGLASTGPNNKCRIGPVVDSLTLSGVTSVSDVAADAAAKWEAAPWA